MNRALLLVCALALLIAWNGYQDHQALYNFFPARPIFGRDLYGSYLVEAAMLKDGAYSSIWVAEANSRWQLSHGWPNIFNDSPYPPLMALLWVPATYTSLYHAVMGWFYANMVLMFLLGCTLAWFATPSLAPRRRLVFSLLASPALFFSAAAMDCFLSGQLTSLLLATLTGFSICYCLQLGWLAAFFLALSISLKVYPVIFLLVPIVLRDWVCLRRIGLCLVLLTLPLFVYCGLSAFGLYLQYLTQVLPGLVSTPASSVSDQSLKGVLIRLLGPAGGPIAMTVGLAIIAISIWRIRQWPASALATRAYALALVSLIQLTCIGRSWPNYHVALALTLAMSARAQLPASVTLASLLLYTLQALADGEVTTTTNGIYFRNWIMESGTTLAINLGWWSLLTGLVRPPQGVPRK
ncbi:MAG: glycosyltransferase family 87 protein [Vulcanimicrobiota bacterium]